MKIVFSEDVLITVVVAGFAITGIALVVVFALLTDVWDVALIGLAAGTLFFAFCGLYPGFMDNTWGFKNLAALMAPFLIAATFLGVVCASSISMIVKSIMEGYDLGPTCVVLLIAMLPVGLFREGFRSLSEEKPARPWALAAWVVPALTLDALMWFRPDLLKLPPM